MVLLRRLVANLYRLFRLGNLRISCNRPKLPSRQ